MVRSGLNSTKWKRLAERERERERERDGQGDRERAIKWHKKRYHRRRDITEGHSEEKMEEGEEGGTSQHEIWSSPRSLQLSSPSATNGSTNNGQIKGSQSGRKSNGNQTSPHIWWNGLNGFWRLLFSFFYISLNVCSERTDSALRLKIDQTAAQLVSPAHVSSLHLCAHPPDSIHTIHPESMGSMWSHVHNVRE